MVLLLQEAGWLEHKDCAAESCIGEAEGRTDYSMESPIKEVSQKNTDRDNILVLPAITKERLTQWKKEIEAQEFTIATARQNALNLDQQIEICQ